MANLFCPTVCPTGCEALLPVVPTFGACDTINDKLVSDLFSSQVPLTSGDLTEWNTRLSNSATLGSTANVIRRVKVVKGSIPAVDPSFKTTRSGLKIPQDVERVLTFVIEDDSTASFDYWKQFQCGHGALFWFKSGLHMYGTLTGIVGTLTASYGIEESDTDVAHKWAIQLSFESMCFPDRVAAVV